MQDFFLVIDTETSGRPKKWDAPYSEKYAWPHVLQIAWIILDGNGKEIKKENHYLKPNGFIITEASKKIHHITEDFLAREGKEREPVFNILAEDIAQYKPLIIAHFAELDYCMIEAECHRLAIPSPLNGSSLFCTLKASASYVKNPAFKFLRLNVFYKTLFKIRPENLHNALADAQLTAEIFIHLLKKGEVDQQIVEKHSLEIKAVKSAYYQNTDIFYIVIIIVVILLIALYFYGK